MDDVLRGLGFWEWPGWEKVRSMEGGSVPSWVVVFVEEGRYAAYLLGRWAERSWCRELGITTMSEFAQGSEILAVGSIG